MAMVAMRAISDNVSMVISKGNPEMVRMSATGRKKKCAWDVLEIIEQMGRKLLSNFQQKPEQ